MGLKEAFSYYGRLDGTPPIRDFVNDLIKDRKSMIQTELHEMEDRLRRYIYEAKKEILNEINSIFSDFKDKSTPSKKEIKDVGIKFKSKGNIKSHSE